jgi:hypothetical protein
MLQIWIFFLLINSFITLYTAVDNSLGCVMSISTGPNLVYAFPQSIVSFRLYPHTQAHMYI